MRRALWASLFAAVLSIGASAQTADEIVAKYLQNMGGRDKVAAIQTVRSTGTFNGGGGFEATVIDESKRPNKVRHEFLIQGFTAVNAYDGKNGWRINPFGGKKDPEAMGEDQLKQIMESADFDGPLVDFATKGNKVEFVGREEYEGSDVFKLKVTLAGGTVKHYYLDTEYYIPIKVETRQTIRGSEFESESVFGNYKLVNGVYFPFSVESGPKGSQNRSVVTFSKIEVNVPLDDARFVMPVSAAKKS
jgi:outer membrane lipoprotein-sorting protein